MFLIICMLVLVLSFLVESVWERLQDGIPSKWLPPWLKVWGAVVIAVGLCIFYRVDLVAAVLTLAGAMAVEAGVIITIMVSFSYVGAVITGVFISRGADATHKALVSLFAWLDFKKQGFYVDVYTGNDSGGDGVG